MNRMFQIIQIAIAAVSLVLCTSSGAEEVEKVAESRNETIKIAAIYAISGEAAFSNKAHVEVAKFAVEEINAKGGVLGKQIELIEINNQSTALGSKNAAQQAVDLGVSAVFGPIWSSHALGAAPVLQKAKIPMISPGATNPKVTLVGDYIFRGSFIDPFQAKVMANFAVNDLKAKTAVVLTNVGNAYSIEIADFFIKKFTQLGGKILWEGDYASTATDFKKQLEKTKKLMPDVIYLPGYDRDSGFIIKQARKMGISTVFLGGDGWNSGSLSKYGGDAINGSFFTTHWHVNDSSKRSKAYVARIIKRYPGRKIESLDIIPLAYDCIYILAEAITKAESAQPQLIQQELKKTKDFLGVTGNITFDENGDPINKPVVMLKFENGKAEYVKTIVP